MPTIRQLPTSVVNKIAAGEVIERPASVVKELVENSVDSGATRIDIAVEQGGVELVRVTDNGCGIAADQLPLAVASHATSKIVEADDLFHVTTLGFRGEALASIAEVSRLVLRSRPADCEAGAELEVVGGRAEPIHPVGCPVGTTIEVRQLYFNTPVRHKFLRTTQTEMGHISEVVTRLALAAPHVHFSLAHGGRLIHDLPVVGDLRERIAVLFDKEIADALIEVDSSDEQVRLSGYVANPSQSRGNNRLQYLMLNGRTIRDRSLQHALGEAYRGLLLTGRYPICFLNLELSPALVDVNVHPTKLEVRFQDGGRIYSQLLGTLRNKFLTTDLVARGSFPGRPSDDADITGGTSELYAWAKNQLGRGPASEFEFSQPHFSNFSQGDLARGTPGDALQLHTLETSFHGAPRTPAIRVDPARHFTPSSAPIPSAHFSSRAIQIHNRYLVVENADGLEVIDQHALHERILYEQLREKVAQGQLESQRLLVPEPVDMAGSEAGLLLEHREVLAQLGLEIEPFGGETVLVAAYPAMLANFSPREVLLGLVEQLQAGGKRPESRDLLDELLHMIACKAAIKFGDRLTPEEVEALLSQRHLAQDHHHCPHGRPTTLTFTREELDRQFKRI
ncbi:MAG: DNA mismatch repair endonuclease MutL [Bythopirellula sp.]|nr:DNA mismatch repair endonuclease MutL [Bythopirellula sp.]